MSAEALGEDGRDAAGTGPLPCRRELWRRCPFVAAPSPCPHGQCPPRIGRAPSARTPPRRRRENCGYPSAHGRCAATFRGRRVADMACFPWDRHRRGLSTALGVAVDDAYSSPGGATRARADHVEREAACRNVGREGARAKTAQFRARNVQFVSFCASADIVAAASSRPRPAEARRGRCPLFVGSPALGAASHIGTVPCPIDPGGTDGQ